MLQRYVVIFEHGARNWSAYSPDVPGCIATGKTLDEIRRSMWGALEAHLRWMHQEGDAIPASTTRPEDVADLAPRDMADWVAVEVPERAAA